MAPNVGEGTTMLEVKRGEPETGRARRSLAALVALAVVVVGAGVMLVVGAWWAAVIVVVLGLAAFATPGIVLRWNWNRPRRCPHCGDHSATRERDAVDVERRRRYIPAYVRQAVALKCGACAHRFSVRLARPYWGA